MRCLRCALDYGPDGGTVLKCGRTLSRPLGSEKPETENKDRGCKRLYVLRELAARNFRRFRSRIPPQRLLKTLLCTGS